MWAMSHFSTLLSCESEIVCWGKPIFREFFCAIWVSCETRNLAKFARDLGAGPVFGDGWLGVAMGACSHSDSISEAPPHGPMQALIMVFSKGTLSIVNASYCYPYWVFIRPIPAPHYLNLLSIAIYAMLSNSPDQRAGDNQYLGSILL